MNLNLLETEKVNPRSVDLDLKSTIEILKIINDEYKIIPFIIEKTIPEIGRAVDVLVTVAKRGGKIYFFGCGTSGRLAAIDVAEWKSTFGVEELARVYIGVNEDSFNDGYRLAKMNLSNKDVAIGISASGRTPFVIGALKASKDVGANTISIINNPVDLCEEIVSLSDVVITIPTGPEVIVGSTRMKAGTSQKIVLNMLSTALMVKLGKVYSNYMINVKPVTLKLEERAIRIISEITGASEDVAREYYLKASKDVKLAVVMIICGVSLEKAKSLLRSKEGILRNVIRECK